jgi:hypothetical protein
VGCSVPKQRIKPRRDRHRQPQQSEISLADAGAEKFQIGKQTDNSLYMYDASNTRDFLDYYPTSGSLAFNRIAGNVGIGTSTPGTLFSIGSSGGINFSLGTSTFSTTGGLNITGGCYSVNGTCLSTGGSNYWTSSGGNIFNNTGTNVGVNNASPAYALDVGGFINTGVNYGFKQAGNTILFASSTNWITSVGQSALANYFNSAANAGKRRGWLLGASQQHQWKRKQRVRCPGSS